MMTRTFKLLFMCFLVSRVFCFAIMLSFEELLGFQDDEVEDLDEILIELFVSPKLNLGVSR